MASWTATSNTIWYTWVQNTTATTTTHVWDAWSAQLAHATSQMVTGSSSGPYHSVPPPELSAEAQRAREALRQEAARQQRIALKKNHKARENARKLLMENLSDQQKEEFERDGFFHVETRDGQRRYRLAPGAVPIRVHGEDGRRFSYCIHPRQTFPAEDVTLALKLMLETDEDEFLRTANASSVR